jgi:acyl carrier protein
MDLLEIKDIVKKAITDIVAVNGNGTTVDIADDDSLIDSGLIDSISAIQIIEACSEKFDIIFYPAELSLENFDTIAKITGFIEIKLKGEDA